MRRRQAAESALGLDYWRLCFERTASSWRAMFARGSIGANVSAGLTVALVAIPLNLALAIACGLPPAVGLVTGAVAGVLGALIGASPYQITGPEVALAPITLTIVTEHGFEGLIAVTFLAGIMQIGFGLLRLGRVVNAIPVPVVGGFLAAVGLLVFDSQLPRLLGLPAEVRLLSEIRDPATLLDVSPAVAVVGLAVIGLVVILPRHSDRLPAPLIALGFAVTPIVLFDAQLPTVSAIEGGVFHLAMPGLSSGDLVGLLPSALALALLASTDSLLCAVSVDARTGGERTRSDQELVAQGIANMVSACFGGMPVAAAVVRSAAAIEAGATTRLASLVQSLVLGAVLLLLGSFVSYVPLVALAAILLVVGFRLIQVRQLMMMWRLARFEAVVFVVTATGILVADFVIGVLVGVVAALVYFAHQQRRELLPESDATPPRRDSASAERVDAGAGVSLVRLAGPLFFGSQDRVVDLVKQVDRARPVMLDLSRVTTVDTSGALALARAISELAEGGVTIHLEGLDTVDPLVPWALEQESESTDDIEVVGENGSGRSASALENDVGPILSTAAPATHRQTEVTRGVST